MVKIQAYGKPARIRKESEIYDGLLEVLEIRRRENVLPPIQNVSDIDSWDKGYMKGLEVARRTFQEYLVLTIPPCQKNMYFITPTKKVYFGSSGIEDAARLLKVINSSNSSKADREKAQQHLNELPGHWRRKANMNNKPQTFAFKLVHEVKKCEEGNKRPYVNLIATKLGKTREELMRAYNGSKEAKKHLDTGTDTGGKQFFLLKERKNK